VGLSDQLSLYSCLVHYPCLAIDCYQYSSLSRSRCSEGVFSLWLGDKGIFNGKTSTIFHILTQYTRWTTLRQERDQKVPYFTNIFHTLHTKLGIKDSECHLVLKYRGCLHRYIQTKMEIMDIASLGTNYRYTVKIKHKFKQKRRDFGSQTPHSRSREKASTTHKARDQVRMVTLRTTNPSHNTRREMRRQRRT
jgi:hypothetical protein